ncbi:glycine/D-amino acid oxidase-like deaminating enzyme [Sinorhizobium fredii]
MDYDVIVIGGGLVGVSIAWGLSKCGQRVAIVDEGDLANRAARANFGLVWSSSKGLGNAAYSRWSRTSTANWHQLAAELKGETGIDTWLCPVGRLLNSAHANGAGTRDSIDGEARRPTRNGRGRNAAARI